MTRAAAAPRGTNTRAAIQAVARPDRAHQEPVHQPARAGRKPGYISGNGLKAAPSPRERPA